MITIDQKWQEIDLGQDVTAEIRPLNTASLYRASALMLKHSSGDGEKKMSEKDTQKMSRALMADPDMIPTIKEIVPENVRNIKGVEVQDAEGSVRLLEPADLCELGACMGFAITAFVKLIEVSQLTRAETKNSKRPPRTP